MSGDPSDDFIPDPALVELIDQILEREAQKHKKRRAAPYDGVMGEPPEWVPEWHQVEFIRLRNELLDYGVCNTRVTPEQVLKWLDAWAQIREIKGDEILPPPYIPSEVSKTVEYLADLRFAVSLGKQKGLEFLTGPAHAKYAMMGKNFSRNQSEKAKKPRGKVSDDGKTMTINEIIGQLTRSPEHIDELGDVRAKGLWPLLFSELASRHLHPEEISHSSDLRKTRYLYDFGDGRKTITFGQFSNVVSYYRSGKKSG